MARFQVFIPKTEQNPLDSFDLVAPMTNVGLSDLIGNAAPQRSGGPDGQDGFIVSWPVPGDAETGYKPDRQTWIKAAPRDGLEAGRYWVGIWNDKKPTQKDLKRTYQYSGKKVALNDGNEWLIPSARELPTEMILADDGTFKFEVQRKYHDMYNETMGWAELIRKDDSTPFLWHDLALFVLSAFKLNYMATDELATSGLRLFSKEKLIESLYIICGA